MSWIGVDFDATIAEYDGWKGPLVLGKPIPAMVERVKTWLAAGYEVRIFTARAEMVGHEDYEPMIAAMKAWCLEHVGQELAITATKDFGCIFIVDDRAISCEPNTGRLLFEPTRLALRESQ